MSRWGTVQRDGWRQSVQRVSGVLQPAIEECGGSEADGGGCGGGSSK